MTILRKIGIGIVVLLVFIFGYIWTAYNSLVTKDELINTQFAQVETQYQRRFDLMPNLVASVKGAMAQEKEVFEKLADARSKYSGAKNSDQKIAASAEVDSAFSRLLVVMENYPQLKSVETVQTLMSQIEGTENRISVERKRYNDTIKDFNIMIKRIPSKWVANYMDLSEKTYFEAVKGSEVAPKVDFNK